MARAPKPTPAPAGKPAAIGDNSGALTEQEQAALQLWYATEIRKARKAADAQAAIAKSAREVVNGFFSNARGDLHMTRKDFEAILEAEDLFIEDEAKYRAQENARSLRLRRQGLPAMQGDLFDSFEPKDTADEKAAAYEKGKAYGLRGDDPPLKDAAAHVRGDLQAGWADGQKELADKMVLAMGAKAKLERKAAKGKPNLAAAPTPEPGADDVPDILGGPTADETFDAPDGEEGGQDDGEVDHDAPLGGEQDA